MNTNFFWTIHALENLQKRLNIKPYWIFDTIDNPDSEDNLEDKIYYYKKIGDFDNRVLKVVVSKSQPSRVITFHFHRGLKGKI